MKFREMYPEIVELDLKIESKNLRAELMNTDHFFLDDPIPARVNCGNRECREGGYDLTEIINPLYYAKDRPKVQEKEGNLVCRGYEKIGRGTRSCVMMATYKVKITYGGPGRNIFGSYIRPEG